MGLDPRKQEVSWEESQSKKKRKGINKNSADRYYSAVSRQMLKSEAPVSTFPIIPECSGATGPASFLPLTEENTKEEPGRKFSHNGLSRASTRADAICSMWLQLCGLF